MGGKGDERRQGGRSGHCVRARAWRPRTGLLPPRLSAPYLLIVREGLVNFTEVATCRGARSYVPFDYCDQGSAAGPARGPLR